MKRMKIMCDDKYDSLVVDIGCIMGDIREEVKELEHELIFAAIEKDDAAYMSLKTKIALLLKYHDRLNEVL
jgi:precorrin-6B methylase 2